MPKTKESIKMSKKILKVTGQTNAQFSFSKESIA